MMSVDNPTISHRVTSKYFSSNSGMDESLSDFQEKKKIAAPKVTNPKPKTKKVLKKPRGQKDIRTVLKPKKSELVKYAKDFDNVCKHAGIDVDSEQLQLAIALSKSVEPSPNEPQTSQESSQDRTARIRSTLLEYGFTVPEIKISSTNRRLKKHKKNYKLLLQSETDKQLNIADKYSQVLLQNICKTCSPKKKLECNNSDANLFFLTTTVPYETIRDDNLYYLKNLPLERSSKIGSLLKDWSEIPGRPVSPKRSEDFTMDVSEILCSQEELNIVLSGALKTAKDLIRNKLKVCTKNINRDVEIVTVTKKCDDIQENTNNKSLSPKEVSESTRSCSPDMFDDESCGYHYEIDINMHLSHVKNPYKEARPIAVGKKQCNQGQLSQNVTKRKSNDVMELTECVGINLNSSSNTMIRTDATKRKSDDFMELTECVVQEKVHIEDNIDLTQNSDNKVTEEKDIEIKNLTQSSSSNDTLPFVHVSGKNNDSLDDTVVLDESEFNILNRSPGKEDILIEATPFDNSNEVLCDFIETPLKKSKIIEESSHDSFFEDFVYNHSHSPEQNDTIGKSIPDLKDNDNKINLTQSPDQKNNTHGPPASLMKNKYKIKILEEKCDKEKSWPELQNNSEIDLTQSSYENDNMIEQSPKSETKTDVDLTQSPEKLDDTIRTIESELSRKDHAEMDLTQNSSGPEDINIDNFLTEKLELFNKSSLGKQGDVSIDYDELCTSNASSSKSKTGIYETSYKLDYKQVENNSYVLNNSTRSTNKHSDKIDTTHMSQESEDFEISDKELNYSMHKSRYEDCFEVNFGGISVVDGNRSNRKSNTENLRRSNGDDNHQSTGDSFLPEVNIKSHEMPKEPHNSGLSPIRNDAINNVIKTPINNKSCNKRNGMYDIVKTPGNGEYIIKTAQVTPMGDFTVMSTPERNKELEKYGLKPLKRKRAIQLLTHIYNETHPLVEPCTSEVESPSKKRRTEPESQISPKKSSRKNFGKKTNKSPRKIIERNHSGTIEKSPIKNLNSRKNMSPVDINYETKDNIYEVTNERVEIRNIECGEDEWVFQKKEKAKLHSCRVPLHIVFHNYVSCRRGLREAILRYEPIEIDVIHKQLAASGHRYDPKDLLKFLDKKCITVKTVDNNARSNRK